MTSGRVARAGRVVRSAKDRWPCCRCRLCCYKRTESPLAVLLMPVGVAVERIKTDGRVVAAGCEAEKRIFALSGVVAGIASVRCGRYRLRSR